MNDQQIQKVIDDNGGNFRPSEFLAGRENIPKKMFAGIVQFRNWSGYMMQITSGYRSSGAHSFGAFDFLMWKKWRKSQPDPSEIWRLVTTWPWMGVGIYFDWNDGIGIHVDLCTPNQRQRPLRWLRTNNIYYYQSTGNGLFYTNKANVQVVKSLESEIKGYNKKNEIT